MVSQKWIQSIDSFQYMMIGSGINNQRLESSNEDDTEEDYYL